MERPCPELQWLQSKNGWMGTTDPTSATLSGRAQMSVLGELCCFQIDDLGSRNELVLEADNPLRHRLSPAEETANQRFRKMVTDGQPHAAAAPTAYTAPPWISLVKHCVQIAMLHSAMKTGVSFLPSLLSS